MPDGAPTPCERTGPVGAKTRRPAAASPLAVIIVLAMLMGSLRMKLGILIQRFQSRIALTSSTRVGKGALFAPCPCRRLSAGTLRFVHPNLLLCTYLSTV